VEIRREKVDGVMRGELTRRAKIPCQPRFVTEPDR